MHPSIAEKCDDLAALCRSYGVTRLEVFGSAARGSDFDPAKSDADFLVAFAEEDGLSALDQVFGFAEALEDILGRPVDLVESRRSAIRIFALRSTARRNWSMERDPRVYLWDVGQAADEIVEFTAALDAAGYQNDPLVRAAVERKFEIIGEALNKLSKLAPELAHASRICGGSSGFATCSSMAMRPSIARRCGELCTNRSPAFARRFPQCWLKWGLRTHDSRTPARPL